MCGFCGFVDKTKKDKKAKIIKEMSNRIINGNYPDTNKLIPETSDLKIKLDLNNFYNAIDRASLLTNTEEKNIIKIIVDVTFIYLVSNPKSFLLP